MPANLLAQTSFLDDLVFEQLATGLLRPVAITHAGDGSDRLFITAQDGQIVIYDGEKLLDPPFLDITSRVSCCGERGLLSVAFHPEFASNGLFYVDYTDRSEHPGDVIIARFKVSEDPNIADPDSEQLILQVDQPTVEHNGGQLLFGPNDGFLYISLGDGGNHGLPVNPARSLSSLFGTILRIDVDQGDPYAIPATNPLFGQEGVRQEIWAYGLRNPWRFSFDRLTGDLFIGDVGQGQREEIDFQPANSMGLENYGWDVVEGSLCFDPELNCDTFGLEPPILEYSHDVGCAVAAGYRYRGTAVPELDGVYLYGDFCSGVLFAAMDNSGQWSVLDTLEPEFPIWTLRVHDATPSLALNATDMPPEDRRHRDAGVPRSFLPSDRAVSLLRMRFSDTPPSFLPQHSHFPLASVGLGTAFLLAVDRAFGRIHVENNAVRVIAGLRLRHQLAVHCHQLKQVFLAGQQLSLEAL